MFIRGICTSCKHHYANSCLFEYEQAELADGTPLTDVLFSIGLGDEAEPRELEVFRCKYFDRIASRLF